MRYYQHQSEHQKNLIHHFESTLDEESGQSNIFNDYLKWPLIGMVSVVTIGIIIYAIYQAIKRRPKTYTNYGNGIQQQVYQNAFHDYSGLKPKGNNFQNKKEMLQSVTWKLETQGKGR